MQWVLAFLRWTSNNWSQRGNVNVISSLTVCPYQLEGLHAYACQQAHVFHNIHNHLGIWKGLELPCEHLVEPTYPADLGPDAMELDGNDV